LIVITTNNISQDFSVHLNIPSLEQMIGLKTVYSTYTVGLLLKYIGYKEEVRHLPRTLT